MHFRQEHSHSLKMTGSAVGFASWIVIRVREGNMITLHVNGTTHHLDVAPDTPLLYVLRNDLGLKGPKYGCGEEQCGACKVLVDGEAVPSCKLDVRHVQETPVVTVEGLAEEGVLHPLQEAFAEEQAVQCGYCAAGMIVAAQGLLNRTRYPTDDQIREALADNLCRCGIYDRVRRAIRLRIGRPDRQPKVEMRTLAAATAGGEAGDLPRSLAETPELDRWVRVNEDATITLFTGKVEYGQGLQTAIAQIGAEELEVDVERIRVVMADTAQTPDEGLTVGSMSLETSGQAIRWAAAAARHHLLSLAFEELEAACADPDALHVEDGAVVDPVSGRRTTYWDLLGGRRFGTRVTGAVRPRPATERRVLGRPVPRLDLPAKVTGAPAFLHDVALPGMLYARVVRPPRPGARLVTVDAAPAEQMEGVLKVVRDGSFLGVIARREEQAVAAAEALREGSRWEGVPLPALPEAGYRALFEQPAQSFPIVEGAGVREPVPPIAAPGGAAQTVRATYSRPFQMHAALGPSAAVGLFEDGKLTLWVHSQGVYPQRENVAHVLGMAEEDLHVIYRHGSGCYGHNGADDAALDAALLARAFPGRPVALQWTRADEHGWEPYAPAMRVALQASLDEAGQVVDWNHDVYSPSHLGRSRVGEGTSGLLASWHLADPFEPGDAGPILWSHVGSHRNADPLYAFPRRRIVKHHLRHSPLRTSSMRGLGAFANVFAIESFMDELAHAAGEDPVSFRLRHLEDQRARAVIEAAAKKAGWQQGNQGGDGRGRGVAFAQYKNRQTYAAVVVEARVDGSAHAIHLERAVIAADAGEVVNPDGLGNQLEGGFVQAASQTLYEEVVWNEKGITSVDWDSYPILRFPAAPVVEVVLLNRPGVPSVGAGEAAQGPTPAAIANAVYATAGIRLREIPFTPKRVKAALAATA